jgi:thioredoxin reductase (NADPH)
MVAPRSFVGELALLTGQRHFLAARVVRSGRVLVIDERARRELMSKRPTISDKIFSALIARREYLRSGDAASVIRIVGSRYSPEALSLRSFADHMRLPYSWLDVEEEDVGTTIADLGVGPGDMPAVIMPGEILRRASPASFAERLGLTFRPVPGHLFDLVIVGSGPAGLAGAVYGAAEGLRTVSLDAVAIGGQAGASSRIENYMGFPRGISGGDLTARAAAQAMRLGARLNAPSEVVGLRSESAFHVLSLADGSEVPTRAVIAASGARYRRLDVEDLGRFEGAGVYYAATDREAALCAGGGVVVVGGGNSAGQAAIYLSQRDCAVTIAIRGTDLARSMSRYLIERIEADPDIHLITRAEISRLTGNRRLQQVTVRHLDSGKQQTIRSEGLFSFIGAEPSAAWLGDDVLRDAHGFVLTDRQLPARATAGALQPLPFETSLPGVFAVGDVRSGSLKRVAAAAGEGSSAVRSVYERLHANAVPPSNDTGARRDDLGFVLAGR